MIRRHLLSILFGAIVVTGSSFASADDDGKVRVFVLAGQSNMEGHGIVAADPARNEGKGSLAYVAEHQPESPIAAWRAGDGSWRERDDVLISYLDRHGRLRPGFGANEDRIGPELGFGTVVGDRFDAPVLLVKLAWGGKSLGADFRPPSAGGEAPGPYYVELVERTKKLLANLDETFPELAGREIELAGIGWHQGWNDRVNQAFNDEYEKNLACLIRDLRREFDSPRLPFVIAETGMSGESETHPRALSLMRAQAAVAEYDEFRGTVAFVGTRAFYRPAEESPSGQAYHWNTNAETYWLIGEGMGTAMLSLLDEAAK
ncbi:MAG TPA: sialate O-acetylesterase [Planctomycetaceae bacterium]|nr:sialate O-acetylesterase [Planctomycetaceae bacterium]HRE99781.1 sialate O-acetylesterase [Pirellulaceae bacterium]